MALTIGFLRAVNVAGRKIMMADLRAMLVDLGFEDAKTVLNSGNVVFDAGRQGGAALEAKLEAATETTFGLATDWHVRTGPEWAAALAANPFPDFATADPSHMVVAPMKSAPAADAVAALQAAVTGPEKLAAVGRELFITYPDNIGESKLTLAVIERRLGVRATGRNWNTAMKLAALAGGG
jgi:uncharacterized protein (DUF1697 family)